MNIRVAGMLQGPNLFGGIGGQAAWEKMKSRLVDMNYLMINVFIKTVNNIPAADFSKIADTSYMINKAHDDGYKVLLRIMHEPWNYDPTDPSWYSTFKTVTMSWVSYADAEGVDALFLSNEMANIEGQELMWDELIQDAKAVYHGLLGYETNWWYNVTELAEKMSRNWFTKLDFMAVSSYWPASDGTPNPSVASILTYLDPIFIVYLEVFGAWLGKPLVLTIGLSSVEGAAAKPWIYKWDIPPTSSYTEQLNYYEAYRQRMLESLDQTIWGGVIIDGAYKTSPTLTPDNTEFMVTDKPAEEVVQLWFAELKDDTLSWKYKNDTSEEAVYAFRRERIVTVQPGEEKVLTVEPDEVMVRIQ